MPKLNILIHAKDRKCSCVSSHSPVPDEPVEHHIWPLGKGGPDRAINTVWVCATTHKNIHTLERLWYLAKGEPPWSQRRQFSHFTREFARRAYQSAIAQELVP